MKLKTLLKKVTLPWQHRRIFGKLSRENGFRVSAERLVSG
jgi:hypothetical protein